MEAKDNAHLIFEMEENVSSPWGKDLLFIDSVVPDVAVKRISNMTAGNKTMAI
jgi:hypothetical protein